MLDQLVFFYTGRSGLTDIVLFVVIVGTLLYRGEAQAPDGRPPRSRPGRSPSRCARCRPRSPPIRAGDGFTGALLTLGIVGSLLAPRFMSLSGTHFLATVLLVAVVAVSLTVLTGWAGQMSIGQWALAGVGGVLGAKVVTEWGVPFWVGFVAAAVLGGLVALLLGFPALRLGGTALAVVTLGFAVAVVVVAVQPGLVQGHRLPAPSRRT